MHRKDKVSERKTLEVLNLHFLPIIRDTVAHMLSK